MLDAGYWILDAGYLILDGRCRMQDGQCRMDDAGWVNRMIRMIGKHKNFALFLPCELCAFARGLFGSV